MKQIVENSNNNVWNIQGTYTTLFLLHPFQPLYPEGDSNHPDIGFKTAYIGDTNRAYDREDLVYLLFKPANNLVFERFLESLENRALVYDDYDYEKGHVVVVLLFPQRFLEDMKLIIAGKYTQCSEEYKRLFPQKMNIPDESGKLVTEEDSFLGSDHV